MKTVQQFVFVSDNRLFAEATGAALVSEGVISSYAHVRFGQHNEYLAANADVSAIVMLDVGSQESCVDVFSTIRRLTQKFPDLRIIAIGDGVNSERVAGCIESGASTFVLECGSLGELATTVRSLKNGHSRCCGSVIDVVLQRIRELSMAKCGEITADASTLTQREVEVLELVGQQLLTKEIARRLDIAVPTVKNHLHAIFAKLQVSGRRQAVRQAIAMGLLQCDGERVVA